jgi:hypothetical protein
MDLVDRGDWQQLTTTTTIFAHAGYTYPAGGGQYIASYISEAGTASSFVPEGGLGGVLPAGSGYFICPGLKKIIRNTFFCTTTRLPVYGPLTDQEWAYMRALTAQPAQFAWKQEKDMLLIYPYSATAQFSFMYVTRFPIYNTISGGPTSPQYDIFTADTDASVLPDKLVLQDLKWRWKAAKELPYAEDQRIAENMLADALGSNVAGPDLVMDNTNDDRVVGPGLLVAAGSWPL